MTKLAVRQVSESHNGLREMPRAEGDGGEWVEGEGRVMVMVVVGG